MLLLAWIARLLTVLIHELGHALPAISTSLEMDPGNAYAYRNLGIYHLDRNEKSTALELFLKAKDLDAGTHMILPRFGQFRYLCILPEIQAGTSNH